MSKILAQSISYCVFLNIRIRNLHYLWQAIKVINSLLLMLQLIQDQVIEYSQDTRSESYVGILYSVMRGRYCSNGKYQNLGDCYYLKEFSYVMSFLFFILVTCIVLFMYLQINLTNTQKYNKFITLILYFPLLIMVIIQITYYFLTAYLLNSYILI